MTIGVGFVGQPWLAHHAAGRGRYGPIPVRDILGIPPGAVERTDAIVVAEVDRQVLDVMARRRS
jgi:hypothetical protein